MLIMVALYFIVFSGLSILKHVSFFSTGLDLGIYEQVIWGFSHGKIVTSMIETPINHVQPFLLLVIPFYLLYQSPITLLIIQSLFIAVSAIPFYLFSRNRLKNELAALIISVSYLLYLPLWYSNLFDFHPVVLALPFLMFALFFLDRKKYKSFVISMIFASACKEQISLLLIPMGVYLFIKHKKRLLGAVIAILGFAWFVVSVYIIIPHVLGSTTSTFFTHNPVFGTSLYEAIKTIILNPFIFLRELFGFSRFAYLALLLIPMGFFAVFALEFLFLGLTEFLLILLHAPNSIPEIVYHHQITLVAFVSVATVVGISRVCSFFGKIKSLKKYNLLYISVGLVLFLSILSNIIYGPFSILYDLSDFNPTSDYVKAGHKVIDMIPREASVAAPNWVLPHLSQRDNVFRLSNFLKNTDYIRGREDIEYIVLDFSDALNDPKRSARKINSTGYYEVLGNPEYEVIYQEGSWFLLEHKS